MGLYIVKPRDEIMYIHLHTIWIQRNWNVSFIATSYKRTQGILVILKHSINYQLNKSSAECKNKHWIIVMLRIEFRTSIKRTLSLDIHRNVWIGVQAIALPASSYLDHHQWPQTRWVEANYGDSVKLIYRGYGRKPIILLNELSSTSNYTNTVHILIADVAIYPTNIVILIVKCA